MKRLESKKSNKNETKIQKSLKNKVKLNFLDLKRVFDAEIEMRKEKLSELDDEYIKEIKFLKQVQSKRQISGEEFQKRLRDIQTEYKTKKDIETTQLTKTEESKKLKVERKNKLSKLETE